jgi:DNA mismatch repair protein MLH1
MYLYVSVLSFICLHIYSSDRLVDCTTLKRAIEFVYSATLPQASKPFIYMPINLPPEHVDVNIHPTKKRDVVEHSYSDV